MGTKKRNVSVELLRILAMMMVIMLHYLYKGNILPSLTSDFGVRGYGAWLLESFSIVAVNVYMLISGFFLSGSVPKCHRLIGLICQVLFYSICIPLILLGTGIIQLSDINLYKFIQYIFPVQMGEYWFATAYVVLYLLSPLLGIAVRHMSKQQLFITLGGLLIYFSFFKSVLPVRLASDQLGYDALWFICVYLTAAAIRLYGLPGGKLFGGKGRAFCWYLGSCFGLFGLAMVLRQIYFSTDLFQDYLTTLFGYNHILNLLGAVGIFYTFLHLSIKEGWFSKWICRIAPYTFGVYLLHEQIDIRFLWPGWLAAGTGGSVILVLFRCLGSVLLVFTLGILIDMLRSCLFRLIGRALRTTGPSRMLDRIDRILSVTDQT
jgi:surface polysaccharide O-acyltransferase-like enzyme